MEILFKWNSFDFQDLQNSVNVASLILQQVKKSIFYLFLLDLEFNDLVP